MRHVDSPVLGLNQNFEPLLSWNCSVRLHFPLFVKFDYRLRGERVGGRELLPIGEMRGLGVSEEALLALVSLREMESVRLRGALAPSVQEG